MNDYKQRSLSQWGTLLIISFILMQSTTAHITKFTILRI